MSAAEHHRKTDDDGDYRAQRRTFDASGIDQNALLKLRLWQIYTLISLGFFAGVALVTYKFERDENRKRYEELKALVASANFRPDPWTGTNMYTFAATVKEWNPDLFIPNPLDIQASRRVTKIKLPEVGMLP